MKVISQLYVSWNTADEVFTDILLMPVSTRLFSHYGTRLNMMDHPAVSRHTLEIKGTHK